MERGSSDYSLNTLTGGILLAMVLSTRFAAAQVRDNALIPATYHDVRATQLNIAESIKQLARQTGTKLLFDYSQAKVRQVQPVQGCLFVLEAMKVIHRGSGLKGVCSSDGVFAILLEQPVERKLIKCPLFIFRWE